MPKFELGSLQVAAPDGYEVKMAVFAAPSDGGSGEATFARNVVMVQEPVAPGTTAEAYSQQQLKQLAQSPASFQVLKVDKVTLMGQSCPLVESHCVGPGGMPLAALAAYVIKGTTALTLTATHVRGSRFNEVKPEFIKIFQSVAGKLG